MQSQFAEGAYAADAEQDFLLHAVLPVTAVELMGNLTVLGDVGLEVGIEEIEVGAADGNLPDAGGHIAAGHSHMHGAPVALVVEHGLGGNPQEVGGVVFGHLVALGGDPLGEVSVSVQQADGDEVDLHVGCLLEVVAGEDAEASGINLEGCLEAVLHTEVGDGRFGAFRLPGHIIVELLHDGRKLLEEGYILGQFVISLETDGVEYDHGVVAGLVPEVPVYSLEEGLGAFVPAPPKILAKCFKS